MRLPDNRNPPPLGVGRFKEWLKRILGIGGGTTPVVPPALDNNANNGGQTAMNKKALCVGINDYPGTSNDLAGCVNDTANLKNFLVKEFGFEVSGIHALSNPG